MKLAYTKSNIQQYEIIENRAGTPRRAWSPPIPNPKP